MFICGFGIEDKLLSIIGADFGVAERKRAQILKEQHGKAQISTGDMERCHAYQSGTEQDREKQSSDGNHGEAKKSMDWYR